MKDEAARFDRLVLKWGHEVQSSIENAMITILLEGHLGKYVASFLASAGFGNFRLVGDMPLQEKHLWAMPLQGDSQSVAYAKALPALNPHAKSQHIRGRLNNALVRDQILHSDIIIDATNDVASKVWALETGIMYSIPIISASCSGKGASLRCYNPQRDKGRMEQDLEALVERKQFLMVEFAGQPQDELVALAWSSVVAEEAKKFILKDTEVFHDTLAYAAPPRPDASLFKNSQALVVGAGATANQVSYGLARLGFGSLHIVDKDRIKSHNIPRTPFLINHEGEAKAEVLAQALASVMPGLAAKGYVEEFSSGFHHGRYSLIVDCVDNDFARGQARDYALNHRIPQLSVATTFERFSAALCVPGKTSCLFHHYHGMEVQVRESEARIRAGCEDQQPSNSWMQPGTMFGILSLPSAFFPEIAGEPKNNTIYYHAAMRQRLKMMPSGKPCGCWDKNG